MVRYFKKNLNFVKKNPRPRIRPQAARGRGRSAFRPHGYGGRDGSKVFFTFAAEESFRTRKQK